MVSAPSRVRRPPCRLVCAILAVIVFVVVSPRECMALKQPVIITATTTTVPPLVDVPTFSMATCNRIDDDDAGSTTTNMNILTYATPVSVRPDRVWSIGLYKETLSYQNFCRDRSCILQLLTDKHIPLVKLLGGTSGNDVDKGSECAKLGFQWGHLPETTTATTTTTESEQRPGGERPQPQVLPDCAYYLKLKAIGDIVDCGSHCVAICKVEEMFVSKDEGKTDYVSTATLRDLGIITEQGRVAE